MAKTKPFAENTIWNLLFNSVSNTLRVNSIAEVSTSELINVENLEIGSSYYPSSAGFEGDAVKNVSFTGQLTCPTGSVSFQLEATNDISATPSHWVAVHGYDTQNNAVTKILQAVSASVNYAIDYDNINYFKLRVHVITTHPTNAVVSYIRRSS